MSELYIVKNNLEPNISLADRAGSPEHLSVFRWLNQNLGGRAVAIWAGEVVGLDDETAETGELLDNANVSVAGIFIDTRRVVVRRPRASERSSVGSFDIVDMAIFSTSNGPADISDKERERMENNDTAVAGLFSQIGVPFFQEVAFKPLRDNSKNDDEEPASSPPTLRVVR